MKRTQNTKVKKYACCRTVLTICIVVLMVLAAGCDTMLKDLLHESFVERHLQPLRLFDHNSYFPVIEGYQWTYNIYNNLVEVEVTGVDYEEGIFYIGDSRGRVVEGHRGTYIDGRFPNTIIASSGYGFHPVIYADTVLKEGFAWDGGSLTSNDYLVLQEIEITAVGVEIETPEGRRFDDCLEITYTISYPEGYDNDVYLVEVVFYLQRGVGFVQEVLRWSDDSIEINYVVDHSSIHILRYDDNDAESGTSPEDCAVVEGRYGEVAGNVGNLEKAGHYFNGWNTAPDGTGSTYHQGDSIWLNENVTLYAVWEEISEDNGTSEFSGEIIANVMNLDISDGNYRFMIQSYLNDNRLNQAGSSSSISQETGQVRFTSGYRDRVYGSRYTYIMYIDSDENFSLDSGEWYSETTHTWKGQSSIVLTFDNWSVKE